MDCLTWELMTVRRDLIGSRTLTWKWVHVLFTLRLRHSREHAWSLLMNSPCSNQHLHPKKEELNSTCYKLMHSGMERPANLYGLGHQQWTHDAFLLCFIPLVFDTTIFWARGDEARPQLPIKQNVGDEPWHRWFSGFRFDFHSLKSLKILSARHARSSMSPLVEAVGHQPDALVTQNYGRTVRPNPYSARNRSWKRLPSGTSPHERSPHEEANE